MGALGTTQPCSWLTRKMWTALVLVCVSSLSFSEGRATSQDPRHLAFNQIRDNLVKKSVPEETAESTLSKTSEKMTTMTLSPVTWTKRTSVDNSSLAITAGKHRTAVNTSAVVAHPPDHTTSGVPVPLAPMLAPPSLSPTAALGTPGTQAPSGSTSTKAVPLTTLNTRAQPAAATIANASTPTGTQSPSKHTSSHSTGSPAPLTPRQALNGSTPGSTTQALTTGPVADTSRPITPEPTSPSVASVSTTVVTTTKTQAKRPASVPPSSPTPGVGTTSPTPWPGTPQTTEQAPDGTASTRPTTGSSGDSKMPVTDSCQPSTQGQHLVVTTKPLPLSPNRSSLLAVLLLGVTLFFTVLVLFALQAYESYKKKDYTQVDYLINGMYADSEM
ncbi:PREDICTED: uncharacterized protein C11orf24 homolog isoform X2 [Hipposideros armiger]|nr:PREDICTED: uncharacterized protein C11orf24 homolog isoform X2 [Hipposideros armiger]